MLASTSIELNFTLIHQNNPDLEYQKAIYNLSII